MSAAVQHPLALVWRAIAGHIESANHAGFTCKACFHPDREGMGSKIAESERERVVVGDRAAYHELSDRAEAIW